MIDCTGLDITEQVKTFLWLGPKFALPHDNRSVPLLDVVTDSECNKQSHLQLDDDGRDILRSRVCNVITYYYYL